MTDDLFMHPYAVDWENAPVWAQWHAVQEDGTGGWYESCPTCQAWYDIDSEGMQFERETWEDYANGIAEENRHWKQDIDGERMKELGLVMESAETEPAAAQLERLQERNTP